LQASVSGANLPVEASEHAITSRHRSFAVFVIVAFAGGTLFGCEILTDGGREGKKG
jgi:hypothetical protein